MGQTLSEPITDKVRIFSRLFVAHYALIAVTFFFHAMQLLHLAASLLLSPVATSDDSQLGAGQIR
jgi:hypothetical protein